MKYSVPADSVGNLLTVCEESLVGGPEALRQVIETAQRAKTLPKVAAALRRASLNVTASENYLQIGLTSDQAKALPAAVVAELSKFAVGDLEPAVEAVPDPEPAAQLEAPEPAPATAQEPVVEVVPAPAPEPVATPSRFQRIWDTVPEKKRKIFNEFALEKDIEKWEDEKSSPEQYVQACIRAGLHLTVRQWKKDVAAAKAATVKQDTLKILLAKWMVGILEKKAA